MIDCLSAMQQLWDYLDGELTADRMAAVREHLAVCQRCFPHYDFERAFLDAVKRTKGSALAPGGLRARVVTALQREGIAGL
ncbi:MAG: zf-HC2 domain-containing protein [Gemmatimonadota bacterium]|nr:zf-HC2 domain-containing protein [Gemmatimonadota bacterium]